MLATEAFHHSRAPYWNEVVDGQVSSWLETVYLSDSRFPVGAGVVGRKLLFVRQVVALCTHAFDGGAHGTASSLVVPNFIQ